MIINCDIGERGIDCPLDLKLMKYIHIANIACGGHAGDHYSVEFFSSLAKKNNVRIAAHLSYPDRNSFGRKSMKLPVNELLLSLGTQLSLMEQPGIVKLHGALYNDSVKDRDMAGILAVWMKSAGIREVLCPADSFMAEECGKQKINVLGEAFAERTYTVLSGTGRLSLTDRSEPYAVINKVTLAMDQVRYLVEEGSVSAYVKDSCGVLSRKDVPLMAETVCIHSDSLIALELAKELYSYV